MPASKEALLPGEYLAQEGDRHAVGGEVGVPGVCHVGRQRRQRALDRHSVQHWSATGMPLCAGLPTLHINDVSCDA